MEWRQRILTEDRLAREAGAVSTLADLDEHLPDQRSA
jgi:hypothetical protein